MKRTKLTKQTLRQAKGRYIIYISYRLIKYYGKYNMSYKAIDIELLDVKPLTSFGQLPPQLLQAKNNLLNLQQQTEKPNQQPIE
jgi:hypothetical protein